MATLKREVKKLPSEQNLRLLSSLIVSIANKQSSLEDKCITPWKADETYQKDISYVSHNGYVYVCSVTNQDSVFTESHWIKLADNITELTKSDIEALINLSPEEISKLSDLISTEIRLDKVFSSSDTYMRIQAAIETAKEYTNEQTGKCVKPAYKVVASTSDITETGYFYLISNGTNFDMYVLSADGSVVSLGTSDIDLTQFYDKDYIDNNFYTSAQSDGKFATITTVDGKVDKTSIATAISNTPSDEKVLSEKATKTELDGVVKKTDISTTIDGTSTDDTVPTNKAVYDSLINKVNNTIVLNTADEVNSFDRVYQSFIIGPSVAEAVGLPKAPDSTWFCINLSHFKGFKYPSQIAFEYAGIERIMYRTAHNGVWHNWKKLCVTGVADVPKTVVTYDASVFETGEISYEVINGICYVRIMALKAKSLVNNYEISSIPMPKPKHGLATCPITCDGDGSNIGMFYVDSNFNSVPKCHMYDNVKNGYCTFSYPVAES